MPAETDETTRPRRGRRPLATALALLAGTAGLLTVAAPAGAVSFTQPPGSPFASGSGYSRAFTVADFNGDGDPDMAVPSQNTHTVSVLLGLPAGDGFSPPASFDVGEYPTWLASGDFDADGQLDLVVANEGSSSVSLLLGDGSGGFGSASSFAVGINPLSLAVDDFNGDGVSDVAVANINSDTVSVLLADGSGGFSPATSFGVGARPYSLAVADFDGDGDPDLVVANSASDTVSVLLGDGSGGFGAPTNFAAGGAPVAVAVADFDGNGDSDIAVTNQDSRSVSVLLGDGAGALSAATSYRAGTSPSTLAIGDLDGDGNPDLVATEGWPGSVSVLLGSADGSFGASTDLLLDSYPYSVAIADFNRDGDPDLAVQTYAGIMVLLNTTPTASFSAAGVGFGEQALGTIGTPSGVTVTNDGPGPLNVSLARISGGASDDFIISTDTCTETIPAGATCTVRVRFAPTAIGARRAALRIVSDARVATHILGLAGSGTPAPPALSVRAPAGAAGARGPRGRTGTTASLTCRLRGRTPARRRCTVYLTNARGITAVLMTRNGALYASARPKRGATAIVLRNRRHLRAGRYTLVVVRTSSGHKTATRRTVRVG